MTVSSKPLEAITVEDLQDLVEAGARETGVLEFKGALPVFSIKGGPVVDRWIEKGDRVGDHARNEILAEIVAFANADGGTLILGLHETKDEPRCAQSLAPLPNCEGLTKRLLDAAEDIIEPRLAAITARALPMDSGGAGFVLLRTGKSLFGPHRLTTTRDFYIRRGERTAKMTAREIRDHSYNLARAGDRVQQMFDERLSDAAKQFAKLKSDTPKGNPPLLVRVSAAPMSPQYIDRLTNRPQLWWTGDQFSMKVDDVDYPCAYPARDFGQRPQFRLRSLIYDHSREEGGLNRVLNSDGLVEFTLRHPWRELGGNGARYSRVYFGWIYGLIVGAYAQVKHLQSSLAWDAVDFGLNVSFFGIPPFAVRWNDGWGLSGLDLKDEMPLNLPRYEVNALTNIDNLLADVTHDISNACGISLRVKCIVPASAIA
jgi:hypothetical protein